MTGPTERVILVKGDATKWYNQAIFIVNQNTPATKMPVDFVAEAERIIYNHVVRQRGGKVSAANAAPSALSQKHAGLQVPVTRSVTKKKQTSKFDFALNVVMILACIAIVAVLAYGLMS